MPNNDECDEGYGHDDVEEEKSSRLKEALSFRSKDVGGYRLGKTLGKGSCAVVKLGTHHSSGKQVCGTCANTVVTVRNRQLLRF